MSRGGGDISTAVVVYGPDGKAYGSPAAARDAGVENFTMSPPVDRSKDTNSLPKEIIDALPQQFQTESLMPARFGMPSEQRLILPPNAEPQYERGGMGMNTLTGYQIKLEMPANYPKTDARGFPVPPLVANYDGDGRLKSISSQQRYWADNQVHIQPEYSPTGKFLNANPATNEQAGSGGLGGFIQDVGKDYGQMILAGLTANLAAGNFGNLFSPSVSLAEAGAATGGATAGAGTATGSGALSPFASQAAGAYGAGGASAITTGAGLLSTGSPFSVPTGAAGVNATNLATSSTGTAIANQIATQGVTPSLLQSAASFLNVKPETLASFAPSAIQGLLSAGGSYLQSEQAKESAQTQADAQVRAAQIAADAARFRPVGVTTRFGASNFQTDAAGNVISAGYTPSPEILGYQNRLSALANQGLTGAEGAQAAYAPLTGAAQNLFSLGQGYLSKTPEQAAQEYIAKQQALLTPSRENQLAELRNRQFQTGRGGAATAQGGNLMATSPEMAAYYNSIAQSDLVLAAQADQEAQNRIRFGAGLFDTGAGLQGKYYAGQTAALAPFTNPMDVTTGLEQLAQVPLDIGRQIGGQVTAGAAQGGMLTSQGITSAAQTMAPANAYSLGGNVLAGVAGSPNVTGALNRAFGVTAQPAQQQYTFNPATGQYVPVQQFVA
jgi:hypothetical protein